jgi:hypothetical protein
MSEQALARQELLQLDNTLVGQLAGLLAEFQKQNYIKSAVNPHGLLFYYTTRVYHSTVKVTTTINLHSRT